MRVLLEGQEVVPRAKPVRVHAIAARGIGDVEYKAPRHRRRNGGGLFSAGAGVVNTSEKAACHGTRRHRYHQRPPCRGYAGGRAM